MIPPSFFTAVIAAAHPAFFGVQVQKGEIKLIAYNSIPCSNISLAARVLSSPPDRSPTAFIFVFRTLTILRLQQIRENLTRSANFHLFLPIHLNRAFTNGAVNKPAEPSGLELPGRTLLLLLRRTSLYNPARLSVSIAPFHTGD
jgi:hypothetical protein